MDPFTSQFAPLSYPNLGLVRFPDVSISAEDKAAIGLRATASNVDFLRYLTWEGIQKRRAARQLDGYTDDQIVEQLKVEFSTFAKTGVHDYLLMVWDINRWADQQGIMRGWGRGSAASSLTLFALQITHVNPLRHKLNFPRFLSEARMKPVVKDGVIYVDGKSAPDIDCDYQFGRREEVVHYMERKYAGRTSKISTRLELTGKMALKDAVKVYWEASEDDARRVSDMIEARFGKVQSLADAKEKNEVVQAWLKDNPRHQEVYAIAMSIEGLATTKGQHPSGVFVSYHPLDGNVPTELSKTGDAVTSYDMETVAGLGIKADILGVRSLDLVVNTAKMVGLDVQSLNVDDPAIYEYLNRPEAAFSGLFQIESGTTKEAVVKVGPKDIDAFGVCIAISRPGALKYLDQYAEYSRKGTLKTIYPSIDDVLRVTGNVLVYQEQITQICNEVFGLSLIDADQVRYAVGKKKKEEMAKWEPVLYANGRERGIPDTVVKYFWDVCNASADYLFVKSHALAYVYLAASTTYLKAKHPSAFYLVMLQLARDEPNALEYMNSIMEEMRVHTKIKVLPPSILHSAADFALERDPDTGLDNIRFGLNHIRGISDTTMAKLTKFREGNPASFTSKLQVFEAAKAAGLTIAHVASLVLSGCLSWPNVPRTKLLLEAQLYNLLSDTQKVKVRQFAAECGEDLIETLRLLSAKVNEKGKALIPESQLDTLRRKYEPYWTQYQHNSRHEELASFMHERHYLGFSYTSSLHKIYSQKIMGLLDLAEIGRRGKVYGEVNAKLSKETKPERAPLMSFVAFVDEVKVCTSQKNGTPYLKVMFSDDSGTLRGMVYGEERLEACKRANEGQLPKEGDVVTVEGGLAREGSMMFVETLIVQPEPIQFKRSAVKEVVI